MPFDLPDYSYGIADAILTQLDYLLKVGTDSRDGRAAELLEEARRNVLAYKDEIFDQVMQ